MKNKLLIGLLTLIVFFSFIIPNYVLAAPEKTSGRSRAQDVTTTDPYVEAKESPDVMLPKVIFSGETPPSFPESGEFTEITTNLQNVAGGSVAWGDYDNDGDLDILLSGWNGSGYISKIYRNDGNDIFTDINANLPGNYYGTAAWGDYNNDGYLDILLTGGNWISRVYRNDPGPNNTRIFSNINANLVGMDHCNAAWGDYDNDGDLDILLQGQNSSYTALSIIYRNDGNGVFTNINANLPGFYYGSVAWGDYDNDGDLDFLMTQYPMRIYRNDGNNVFTDINAGLITVAHSGAAWGDYDNDGDLDILLSGLTPPYSYGATKIYRNDPGPNNTRIFLDINAGLLGVHDSAVAWGDYDNDGDLDIVLCGHQTVIPYYGCGKIYRNDSGPNNSRIFTDINAELIEPYDASAAWGDYDNDGDLDLLITGYVDGSVPCTKLYRNNSSLENTLPNIPADLQASIQSNGVTLSWQKSTDAQTPQDGLYYNIFVGTTPNGVQIESPMAQVTEGFRRIAAIGSQNENTSWTIKNLAVGTYYWGVQAIDTAFAGSPFATETFVVGTVYSISGQVTLNGVGLGGVTITATNNGGSTTTATNGTYILSNVPLGWSGTVTPSAAGYTFTPQNRSYFNLSANQTNQDYAANSNTYTISGVVKNPQGTGIGNVDIKDSNNNVLATTSNNPSTLGQYSFSKNYGWTGTVHPEKSGYNFSPQSRSYINLSGNKQNQNYVGTLLEYTISGIVKDPSNNGVANVTLKDANNNQLAITAADGTYSFTKTYGWSSTVTPYGDLNQYNFSPVNRIYSNLSSNQSNQDYLAILKMFAVSGTVKDNNGNNIPGATVNGQNASGGTYSIAVNYGTSITLTPQATGYTFAPPSATFTNITSNQTQNFVGTLQTFTVSGTVLDNNNNPIPGATLNGQSVASGSYSITVNYGSSITLTPQATGYDFVPVDKTFTNIASNQTQNFVGTLKTFTIAGTVSGLTIPDNITITAQGAGSYAGQDFSATVGTNGAYSTGQVVPYNWTGNLVVNSAAYNLTAVVPLFNGGPVTANVTQNYTAQIKTFTISGDISGILPSNPYAITISATTTNNPTYGVYQSYPNINATGGAYSITVPYGWQGNITAASVAYNLTPTSINVLAVNANLPGQDFAANLKAFNISGDIFEIIPGANYPITITANCTNPLSPWYGDVTNIDASSGHYDFTLPYGWEGNLTIDSPAYELKENPDITFNSPVTEDQIQNYVALGLKTYMVTGTITFDITQTSIFPITIKAECSNPLDPWYKDVIADASGGFYSMSLPYGWEGNLVPISEAYTLIEDPGITFNTPITSNQIQNYMAKINMFTISGHTFLDGLGNKPIQGVSLQAKGTGVWSNYTAKEFSNSEGDYTVDVPYGFSGLVVPSKEGYEFTPENREYDNLTANIDKQDYIGFTNYVTPPTTYMISGYVTYLGVGIQGVAIVDNTNDIVAYTNAQGYYSFEKQAGWTGTARAVKPPYKFSPISYSYNNLSGNQTDKNYIRVP